MSELRTASGRRCSRRTSGCPRRRVRRDRKGTGQLPDARQVPRPQRQARAEQQYEQGDLTKDELERINRKADKKLDK